METKTIILVAIIAIAAVAVAGVALTMGDDSEGGDVEYNYRFSLETYENIPGHQSLKMDLVLKNNGFNVAGGDSGMELLYFSAVVVAGDKEYVLDDYTGTIRVGNSYVLNDSWSVPVDMTLDDIDDVKVFYEIREGDEEVWGPMSTPTMKYNENLEFE